MNFPVFMVTEGLVRIRHWNPICDRWIQFKGHKFWGSALNYVEGLLLSDDICSPKTKEQLVDSVLLEYEADVSKENSVFIFKGLHTILEISDHTKLCVKLH